MCAKEVEQNLDAYWAHENQPVYTGFGQNCPELCEQVRRLSWLEFHRVYDQGSPGEFAYEFCGILSLSFRPSHG